LVRRPTRAVPVMTLGTATATRRAYAAMRSGGAQKLARVAVGGLVAVAPTQHPDDLGD
jgi:hypothetical protein